jgi:SOS-response transcriptional repressor LexA
MALIFDIGKDGGMDLQWIIDGLRKPGKTRSGLAKALRRAPSAVTSLLAGGRELKAREVAVIAEYLEVDPPAGTLSSPQEPEIRTAFIVGEVAAGVWTEPHIEFERIPTHVALDPRWPEKAVFLLRVRGNSINRQARDGDIVMCLDIFQAPRDFRDGDWVIAEREDASGRIETTIKRVCNDLGDGYSLMPDSDDPNFQTPIKIGRHSGETVRVRAFVIDFIRKATVF